jgi:hypothetical protein
MADANEYGDRNQRQKVQCIPCAICDEYATNNALANDAQITRRFDGGLRHRHRGVSNPPGRPRDGSRRRTGGLLTPPLHQRRVLSASGARQRAPRSLLELSACKSSQCRDLREKTSRTLLHRRSLSTDSLAFSNRANHRGSSRPPSRRQPFTNAFGMTRREEGSIAFTLPAFRSRRHVLGSNEDVHQQLAIRQVVDREPVLGPQQDHGPIDE